MLIRITALPDATQTFAVSHGSLTLGELCTGLYIS
nr:MAG TPA: hypothetical protein [Caudovirales sp. ct8Ze27]